MCASCSCPQPIRRIAIGRLFATRCTVLFYLRFLLIDPLSAWAKLKLTSKVDDWEHGVRPFIGSPLAAKSSIRAIRRAMHAWKRFSVIKDGSRSLLDGKVWGYLHLGPSDCRHRAAPSHAGRCRSSWTFFRRRWYKMYKT